MSEQQDVAALDPTLLRAQLREAQETLRAIRAGEVDALVVAEGEPGMQVYTLSTADRPYRMFVETMRDGAATVSERGVVLYANQRLVELLNVPRSEVVGASMRSFVPTSYHHALADQDGRCGTDGTAEIELLSRGAAPIWTRVGAATLEVDGELMVCLTFTDLTQSRRDRATLADAHQHALEALRTRARFVANMSHEIRTPLNGVMGMTGLMLDTDLTEEQREYVEGARASGDALMSVVDQILDFSKIDAGNVELEERAFAPLAVLEEACAMVAAAAQAKGLDLLSETAGDLPSLVVGDSTRLRQVLSNLMTNAVKFTATGHVCTTLSAVEEQGHWRLHFTVSDTGIGVAAESIQQIFESFSQADGSTTRRYGGTGLGLAICRQLVELMGGEIDVHSVEGEGSTFSFTLLTGMVADAAPPQPTPTTLAGRALVVDDGARSRELLQAQLEGWGLRCTPAATADEAVELFRESLLTTAFDLVVLDGDLADSSGRPLAEALHLAATPAARSGVAAAEPVPVPVPVVMLLSSPRERSGARRLGVEHFVAKPVRQSQLHEAVSEALQPGDGTAVPVAREALAAGPPRVAGSMEALTPGRQSVTEDGSGGRVLLVEDNEVNQLVAARMLQKRGFAVDVAADGRSALEMHGLRQYQAIFMDCHMPLLDGYQTTAEIRRRENGRDHTPIVAMTANTIKGDREKCLASGMDDYLGKPFSGDALDQAIIRTIAPAADRRARAAADRPDASEVTNEPVVLDPTTLDELCQGEAEMYRDIVTMYLDLLGASVDEIARAAESGDDKTLMSEAHQLKGSSASLGALRLAAVCEHLGTAARAGWPDGSVVLLQRLRTGATLITEAMNRGLALVE